jgi:hypothetical protein
VAGVGPTHANVLSRAHARKGRRELAPTAPLSSAAARRPVGAATESRSKQQAGDEELEGRESWKGPSEQGRGQQSHGRRHRASN